MAADQFNQILNSLLSTDNEVRQQAEVCNRNKNNENLLKFFILIICKKNERT